jgi:lipid A 4'-phosphatase
MLSRRLVLRGLEPLTEFVLMIALVLATFIVFAVLPPIDLWISDLFYDPVEGFWVSRLILPSIARRTIWAASIGMVVVSTCAVARSLLLRRCTFGVPIRIWSYILALYVVGPGIIVDGLLKRFWGRARPASIKYFGGEAEFSLPHEITQNCMQNCSFVAGEVAGAMVLSVALIVLLQYTRRKAGWYRLWMAISVVIPLVSAFQRIAAGRHFASDVIMSVIIVGICARVLWIVIRPHQGPGRRAVDMPPDSPYTPPILIGGANGHWDQKA